MSGSLESQPHHEAVRGALGQTTRTRDSESDCTSSAAAKTIVGYGRERTTRDVDARIEYAKDEVLAAAEEQDLDPNWLNENADCSCRRPRDDRTRTFFNAPGLVVTGAPAEHMLAMKIDAARNSDEDDIGVLVDSWGSRAPIRHSRYTGRCCRTRRPSTRGDGNSCRRSSTRGSGTGDERIARRSRTCDLRSTTAIRARFTVNSTLGGVRDLTPKLTPYGADADAISRRGWIRNSRIPRGKRRSGHMRTRLDGPQCDSRTARRPAPGSRGTPTRRSPSPGRVLRRGRSSRCSWPRLLFCSPVDPIRGRDDPPRRRTGEAGGTRAPGRAPVPDGLLPASRDEYPRAERGSPLVAHDPGGVNRPELTPKLTPKVTPYGADARAIPGHPWKRKSANPSARCTAGRHRTRADRRESTF